MDRIQRIIGRGRRVFLLAAGRKAGTPDSVTASCEAADESYLERSQNGHCNEN